MVHKIHKLLDDLTAASKDYETAWHQSWQDGEDGMTRSNERYWEARAAILQLFEEQS